MLAGSVEGNGAPARMKATPAMLPVVASSSNLAVGGLAGDGSPSLAGRTPSEGVDPPASEAEGWLAVQDLPLKSGTSCWALRRGWQGQIFVRDGKMPD